MSYGAENLNILLNKAKFTLKKYAIKPFSNEF
jgi:hypothetical protein